MNEHLYITLTVFLILSVLSIGVMLEHQRNLRLQRQRHALRRQGRLEAIAWIEDAWNQLPTTYIPFTLSTTPSSVVGADCPHCHAPAGIHCIGTRNTHWARVRAYEASQHHREGFSIPFVAEI